MATETAALSETVAGTIADTLAEWLASRYVIAANKLSDQAGNEGLDLKTLSSLTADITSLRKGDHTAERLRIERERLEIERERDERRMQEKFEQWLKQPDMVERLCGPTLTPEERETRMRQIFGLGASSNLGLSKDALAEIERALKVM